MQTEDYDKLISQTRDNILMEECKLIGLLRKQRDLYITNYRYCRMLKKEVMIFLFHGQERGIFEGITVNECGGYLEVGIRHNTQKGKPYKRITLYSAKVLGGMRLPLSSDN